MDHLKKYEHHNVEIEEAILGAFLIERTAFGRIHGILAPESFYREDHKTVFGAMQEMYLANLPIDILTVAQHMHDTGRTINAGAVDWFICRLTNSVVSTANLEYHALLIKELWRKRKLTEIRTSGYDSYKGSREGVQEIQDMIRDITGTTQKSDWQEMDELLVNLCIHQDEMREGKKTLLKTGVERLDALNGGFYGGNMIVIGARPSVGKSAFLGMVAVSMAKAGKKVGIVSLEMSNNEIAGRLAAIDTDMDFARIFRGLFYDENQQQEFYQRIQKTVDLPIYVSDRTKVDINDIRAKAMRLKASKGLDCLMIDYIQLIDSPAGNKNYNREQEMAKLSRGIKLMAMEMEIPVIALAQLNRSSTSRAHANRYPILSDLRESGAIEQDADVVMFLHRDWMVGVEKNEDGSSTQNEADLIVAKWRNGSLGMIKLDFDPPKMKFSNRNEGLGAWKPTPRDYSQSTRENDQPF